MPRITRTEDTFNYMDNQRAAELTELRQYANDINDSDLEEAIAAELYANRSVFPGGSW